MVTVLISNSKEKLKAEIEKRVKEANLSLNHPDMLYLEDEKGGVAAAKKVREHLNLKPYQAEKRGVVISGLTPEAQNALLKIFEEPPESLIIISAEKEEELLPTVLSRCQVIHLEQERETQDIQQFLKMSPEERFGLIEKLEDKEGLIDELIAHFRGTGEPDTEILKLLLNAKEYLGYNVNQRAVLEYVSLNLPKKQ